MLEGPGGKCGRRARPPGGGGALKVTTRASRWGEQCGVRHHMASTATRNMESVNIGWVRGSLQQEEACLACWKSRIKSPTPVKAPWVEGGVKDRGAAASLSR